jgi:FixJ family two-component response regulator
MRHGRRIRTCVEDSMMKNDKRFAPAVVIVDGDHAIRSALTFSLELAGYAVDSYPSGEALLQEQAMPAEACMIIDYGLPGINGLQLLRALRARRVTSPAILLATNPTRSLRAQAHAAGTPIVEKPLLTEDLEKSVSRAFETGACPAQAEAAMP